MRPNNFCSATTYSELCCDAEVPINELGTLESWMRRFAPYGMENNEPVFLARSVRVAATPRIMKERHIRLRLSQGGSSRPAVGWNLAERLEQHRLRRILCSISPTNCVKAIPRHGMELEIVDLRRAENGITKADLAASGRLKKPRMRCLTAADVCQRLQYLIQQVRLSVHPLEMRKTFAAVIVDLYGAIIAGIFNDELDRRLRGF